MAFPNTDFDRKLMKSVATFLGRWNDGQAVLWDFRRSHQWLTLRLTKAGSLGCLYLLCGDTEYYSGPLRWENCQIEVEAGITIWEGESGYRLKDKKADFELRCGVLEVKESKESLPFD